MVLAFDFNDHSYREAHNLVAPAIASNADLTEDRFGNERSAVYIFGNLHSYLNLGTSPLLKPDHITISFWYCLLRKVFIGKGAAFNPLLVMRNGPQDDFCYSYAVVYNYDIERTGACSTKDSLTEALIQPVDRVRFNTWYHVAITSNDNELVLYENGKLKGRCKKNFKVIVDPLDSVLVGHSNSKKNERFSNGYFDDIRIYHRVLNSAEIKALYEEPDPNKARTTLIIVLKCLALITAIILLSVALVWRRRRALKLAKEKLDIKSKLHETEIRTLKAQMNPHFIFNSLNAINQFIMKKENDKAELYLSKFSKLIRDLLESNLNENLTVEEEVRILNGYLEMEALRFGDSFHYSVQVDEALKPDSILIPHMLIQPFVENAIWHGLLPKKGDRKIDIRFSLHTGRTLKCTVDDNGIGRKASQLRTSTFKKKSLALSIVKTRLDLMRQNLDVNCYVEITDKENSEGESLGCHVTVILPIIAN